MPFRDLRSFIKFLDSQDKVIRIREEVDPRYGIARVERKYDGKAAVYFEHIKGNGVPVVANIFHSRQAVADALSTDIRQLTRRIIEASKNLRKVKEVPSGPVKQVRPRDVDLLQMFPLPMHFEKDAGYYITAGVILAKDPDSGVRNLSFARMWVKERQKIVVMVNHYRHLMSLFRKAESQGKDLDVAILIGVDPITWLEGGMPDRLVPLQIDELEVANALMGGGLEVVRAETVGLEVPAESEIVIEGRMLHGVRDFEGPFGDYSQVYDMPPRENPVIQVTAVTHRENPIFLDCLPNSVDNFLLGGIPREADLLNHVRTALPNVNEVHLTPGSCSRFHAVVQMDKQNETDPYQAIVAMYSPCEASRDLKLVIVVDRDVDPFEPQDVEWAVATRTQWDLDLFLLPKMPAALDPSAKWRTEVGLRERGEIYSTKVGLDATVSLKKPELISIFEKVRIP